jgi:hypothetical protein
MDEIVKINRSKEELLQSYKISEIIDAIAMHGGDLEQAALELETFPRILQDVCNYKRVLRAAREAAIKEQQDLMISHAQSDLIFYMSLREINPKLAFEACKYVLDKIGSRRGWGTETIDDSARNKVSQMLTDAREDYERQSSSETETFPETT